MCWRGLGWVGAACTAGRGGELGLAASVELRLWFWLWSGLLVWIVVEGRGLTALQPEVPVFGLEIVALCNFSTKLPVSQIWAWFGLPSLLSNADIAGDALVPFLSSLLALCPLPVVGAHILSSAAGAS